ncbi:DUF6476 family protein [Litorisediminicola beolgyonensis]|uniref:DUF6476 family protein n=1 Tax=Litorisediminicola beolgyonensis TaxID=1173614 RepID=A0ABW3ZIW7_9RHOB
MTDSPDPAPDVRFLKILVTVLTGTMIAGLIVIIALFVIRFRTPGPDWPDSLSLPSDAGEITAVTQGTGWVALVAEGAEILVFDSASGALRQRILIERD